MIYYLSPRFYNLSYIDDLLGIIAGLLSYYFKMTYLYKCLNTLQRYENYIKMDTKPQKSYTLTKKIAKHGTNTVIVIPKFLQDELKAKTIVEVRISVIKEAE